MNDDLDLLVTGELYRIAIPGDGSHYWRCLEIAADGILWGAVGRRGEYITTSYQNVIIEANNPALVGKAVMYAAFSR